MKNKPEIDIMSPVGSFESLIAAIKAGASSVYFGVAGMDMRSGSNASFKLSDLKKIVNICRKNNVRSYLCVNTIIYDEELKLIKKICDAAKKYNISAIIANDVAVMQYCRKIGIEVHISTQVNVSNLEAVKFYSKFVDVVVLARELNLKQIKNICQEIKKQKICGPSGKLVKIEIFIHGALCVSISGKCYMSLATYGLSANKGKCLQNCRRSYKVTDEETGDELVIDNKCVMSPKDLCTIGIIDKILDAGVSVLKIEGRGRSADYVYIVTKVYKEAIESYFNGSYDDEKVDVWIKELESVFNRGFWHSGYYLGNKLGEWSGIYGSCSTKEKIKIGIVKHYFPKAKIGEFIIQSGKLNIGDEIVIIGKTTGIVIEKVKSIFLSKTDKPIKTAKKGDIITIPITERVREGDDLYLVTPRKKFQVNNKLERQ